MLLIKFNKISVRKKLFKNNNNNNNNNNFKINKIKKIKNKKWILNIFQILIFSNKIIIKFINNKIIMINLLMN